MISRVKPLRAYSIAPDGTFATRLYTTQEAADAVGLHPSSVRRLALQHNLGRKLSARVRVFTERDLDQLRQRKTTPGRVRKDSEQ